MTSPISRRPALLSPLRHRDFRLFWTGLLLSSVGSQFTVVAMAWQIYELTDSPLQIGLIGLARAVPQIAILLFGGLIILLIVAVLALSFPKVREYRIAENPWSAASL